jgi:hypothetical protein
VRTSREYLEAAVHLDDDSAVGGLFEGSDPDTVSYACGGRVGPCELGAYPVRRWPAVL